MSKCCAKLTEIAAFRSFSYNIAHHAVFAGPFQALSERRGHNDRYTPGDPTGDGHHAALIHGRESGFLQKHRQESNGGQIKRNEWWAV